MERCLCLSSPSHVRLPSPVTQPLVDARQDNLLRDAASFVLDLIKKVSQGTTHVSSLICALQHKSGRPLRVVVGSEGGSPAGLVLGQIPYVETNVFAATDCVN
jgi:hypothetical protein